MTVTLSTIAKRCNVTKQTVSQILRKPNHASFLPETREQVLKIAQELNYIPNRLAKSLRSGRTDTIGLVLAWNQTQLMDTTEKMAHEHGLGLMVQFTTVPDPVWEQKIMLSFIERQVDGVIWLPGSRIEERTDILVSLQSKSIPMVILEGWSKDLERYTCDSVWGDDQAGIIQSVKHLTDRGYSRIVYLTHTSMSPGTIQRIEYLESAAVQFGCPYTVLKFGEDESTQKALMEYYRLQDGPLGVICDGDFLGLDTIRAAETIGKKVPLDIGVICLGDLLVGGRYRLNDWVGPKLTAIRQPFEQIARKAVELLTDRIEGKRKEVCRQFLIPQELILRESTADHPRKELK